MKAMPVLAVRSKRLFAELVPGQKQVIAKSESERKYIL